MSEFNENKKVVLTPEGLIRLEDELEYLKTIKRKEVAKRIQEATAFGDLSENSEYDEAKKEQSEVEIRILEIESKLSNYELIDENKIDKSHVGLGNKVKIKNVSTNEEFEFTLVGSAETDPFNFKISDESPIGKSLIGAIIGDIVECSAPVGKIKFEILNIA